MSEEAVDYEDFSESEYNKAKENASNKIAASKVDTTVSRSGGKKDKAPANKEAHDSGRASGGANKTSPVKEKHILDKVAEMRDYERGYPWWPKDKPPPSPIIWKNGGARSVGGRKNDDASESPHGSDYEPDNGKVEPNPKRGKVKEAYGQGSQVIAAAR